MALELSVTLLARVQTIVGASWERWVWAGIWRGQYECLHNTTATSLPPTHTHSRNTGTPQPQQATPPHSPVVPSCLLLQQSFRKEIKKRNKKPATIYPQNSCNTSIIPHNFPSSPSVTFPRSPETLASPLATLPYISVSILSLLGDTVRTLSHEYIMLLGVYWSREPVIVTSCKGKRG